MSNKDIASHIKLTSVDELFGLNESIDDLEHENGTIEIPLEALHEFENHPFRVNSDKVKELAESISQFGVMIPGICRIRPKGGYEIIAGHSRKAACELAGLKTMPMVVKNLSDDDATIVMIDTNIQREDISVSEKAKAYKMRYDAITHRGVKGSGLPQMSEETGESQKQIQRYMYLTRLIDEFMEMVDAKKLPIRQAVDISFLSKDNQKMLQDVMEEINVIPSMIQATEIKTLEKEGKLNREMLIAILNSVKTKKRSGKIVIQREKIEAYFDEDYDEDKIMKVILELLDGWKRGGANNG